MLSITYDGSYPNLCSGTLAITLDNTTTVFRKYQFSEGFETSGSFDRWEFGNSYEVTWETYNDGLSYRDWLHSTTYKTILSTIPTIAEHSEELYTSLQAIDFRHGSCGGCI